MELIKRYFPDLSDTQYLQFSQLEPLYREWNQKINLISRKDIDQLYLRHVLHSLAIAKFLEFSPGTKILDVGTGGGFPGIPLAILFPEAEFLLIDSIHKKIKVVEAIIEELRLKNCRASAIRADKVKGKYDFITSRAVSSLPLFISWVRSSIAKSSKNSKPNGILALKGGDLEEELNISYKTDIISIQDYFTEPFFETKKLVHVILK